MARRLIQRLLQMDDLPTLVMAVLVQARNRILFCIFRFNKWHISGTYYSRPYHRRAVSIACSLKPQVVVEIGAGLGDIISRCTGNRRIAFDADRSVIKAAKLLHKRTVRYCYGQFTDPRPILDQLKSLGETQIDLLILINWIHEINSDAIKTTLEEINAGCTIQRILIDTIDPSHSGYPFHHTTADLETLGEIERSSEGGDGIRHLHLLRVKS